MTEPRPARRHVPLAWLADWWLRRWRRVAVVLLLLAGLVLIVRGAANVWVGHLLDGEIARLEKRFGSLDPATLAPPKVPPGENRARAMRAAGNLLVLGDADWQVVRYYSSALPLPTTMARLPIENLERVLERNQLALYVAEQGRRRPGSNFEIDYAHDEANLPRLLELNQLAALLAISCRVDLSRSRTDAAVQAALTGFAEAGSLRQEPILITQLIRMAIAGAQLRCVRDMLQAAEPSDVQLSELAAAMHEDRPADPVRATVVGELKTFNKMFARAERGEETVGRPAPWPWNAAWRLVMWLSRPLIRYERVFYLRSAARRLDLLSVAPFERRTSRGEAAADLTWPRWWVFPRLFDDSALDRAVASMYQHADAVALAELAVALRRFRLERGSYPDALADLAPRYLAQIPINPFTGRPPDYVREGAGFALRAYSAPGLARNDLLDWKIAR